uniref:Retinol dehydrogenase 7-like n=1 Tax=Crassostrea virginica TaxID=6565 RepID=A0A8B8CZQ7_CRAVI|nr:retinol dehydrogenase 7-like [Crassostrea virginica]XP_022321298.1 retinol dehydrogenase 7-like [Crassostrea virginica]XP_022321299.1 retinol dehydrogenase 7-like [Crassostrea virginica]
MNQFCQNPIARKFVLLLILSTILIPVCFIVTLFIPCEVATSWTVLMILTSVVIIVVKMPQKRLPIEDKAVLITGCDSGIGHSLAKQLDRAGFHVFAGCLSNEGEGSQELRGQCSSRLQTLQLDVSNLSDVESALQLVQQQLAYKDIQLWGIVNNAGICYIGNVEIMTEEDMQKIMAVNYMGPVNICKHFLPLIRRSRGRIVNVASNAGLAPVPLMGVYCASKAALGIMSEVWRYELKMWDIKVSTIIPSGYKTGIMSYNMKATGNRWWSQASKTVKEDYGKECFHIKFKQKNRDDFLSAEFTDICYNIEDALLSTNPKTHYYSGFLAKSLPFIYLYLPIWLSDPIMSILVNWFEFNPIMQHS